MASTNPGPAVTTSTITGSAVSNISQQALLAVALTPAQIAANTTAEQTFTLTGLQVNDYVNVKKPTAQAGMGIVGCRVSAQDTLAITFINATAAGITPTAGESYQVYVVRPSTAALPLASTMPLL